MQNSSKRVLPIVVMGIFSLLILVLILKLLPEKQQTRSHAAMIASQAQRITITGQSGNNIHPKVAFDTQNNVHIVWQANTSVMYIKGVWNGTGYSWGQQVQLGGNCATQGCFPAVAVAPNNTVLAVWSGVSSLMYVTGQGTLVSATPKVLSSVLGFGLRPSIAADQTNRFHIVADGDFSVKYCVFDGLSCTYTTMIQNAGSSNPGIAVDSAGYVHFTWSGSQGVMYGRKLLTDSSPSAISYGRVGGGNGPSLAAGGGKVSLAWSENYDITYCEPTLSQGVVRCALAVPVTSDGEGAGINELNPSIANTASGNSFVSFATNGPTNQSAAYVTRVNGGFTSRETLETDGVVDTSATASLVDERVGVVWSKGYDIWFEQLFLTSQLTPTTPAASPTTLVTASATPTSAISPAPPQSDSTSTTILFRFTLPGIDKEQSARSPLTHPLRPVSFTLFSLNHDPISTTSATAVYHSEIGEFLGAFSLPVATATGQLLLSVPHYTQSMYPVILSFTPGASLSLPLISITGSDLNGDNARNFMDYTSFITCISLQSICLPVTKDAADINDDGQLDIKDFNLLLSQFQHIHGD